MQGNRPITVQWQRRNAQVVLRWGYSSTRLSVSVEWRESRPYVPAVWFFAKCWSSNLWQCLSYFFNWEGGGGSINGIYYSVQVKLSLLWDGFNSKVCLCFILSGRFVDWEVCYCVYGYSNSSTECNEVPRIKRALIASNEKLLRVTRTSSFGEDRNWNRL